VREFLSKRNIPFVERNIRQDPQAKEELLRRTGKLVVPVVMAGDACVIGYDPDRLESVVGTIEIGDVELPPRDSTLPVQGEMAASLQADLTATVVDLLSRIREELAYNAAKGNGAYRHGMHDGLKFAEDALVAILETCAGDI